MIGDFRREQDSDSALALQKLITYFIQRHVTISGNFRLTTVSSVHQPLPISIMNMEKH
jgi:hypothetical protein